MHLRTGDNKVRSEAQLGVIRSMLSWLDPFFRIRATMPARQVQAFLLVAEKEGMSVGDYAKKAGISPTTMSRNLLDMGERDRRNEEGAGLVDGRKNLMNRRELEYHLTPKGRALLASITQRTKLS